MTEDAVRRHTLPLEDVQRIHLGLEHEEPMKFDAETIAAMLQAVADDVSEAKAAKIHGVARALRGLDQHHRLELRQVKRGKHKLSHNYAADREQNQAWLDRLATYEREGIKTEAAIAAIAAEWRVSRASIFAGIKSAEEMLDFCRSINQFSGKDPTEYDNPRPSKTNNI